MPERRERQDMYDHAWRAYSRRRLALHPWCVRCRPRGLLRLAVVTDHVVPHRGDRALFRDPDNHQSLCKPCHDRKTRIEDSPRTTTPKPARHA
jgi:5-methylcytosine-specific restriction protein A